MIMTSRTSVLAKTGTFAFATVIVAASTLLSATTADAGRGRDIQQQDYQFDQPMHGYEGRAAGGYYCSYKRIPKRVCKITKSGKEKCKVKGWTLRQTCY